MLINHTSLPKLGTREGDEYWKNVYAKRVFNPKSWLKTADDLVEALDLLIPIIDASWENIRSHDQDVVALSLRSIDKYHPIALMLLSYAVENLSKGLLIGDGLNNIKSWDGKFPDLNKRHDVKGMVESLCNELSIDEQELLSRLGPYARWAGRYPAPLHLKEFQLADKKWGTLTESMSGGDFVMGKKLIARLRSMYEQND